jgi:hypothetical protein
VVDLPATITAIASVIAAIGLIVTGVLAYLARRATLAAAERATVAADAAVAAQLAAESSKKAIVATQDGIFELGKQIDGRLSELLKSSSALARAEGVAQGEQAQRDRAADPQP